MKDEEGAGCNFNPHHHAGGDQENHRELSGKEDFNPHHHAGGDARARYGDEDFAISIHTTTQVVTTLFQHIPIALKISIHTTTQVVTPWARTLQTYH